MGGVLADSLSKRPTGGCLGGSRGQGSVIGVVLIFGITVLSVTAILVAGSAALGANQDTAEVDRAELAMTQFDSRAALVALGDAERQRTGIVLSGRGEHFYVDESAGWVNITMVNVTTDEVEGTLLNATFGALVYENGGVEIAYQGGGVWRKESDVSTMVSPPEFHYRTTRGEEPTLTLPLVLVRGSGSTVGELMIEKNTTSAVFPQDGDTSRSNPFAAGKIVITIQSEYYEAWGEFFELRTDGAVDYSATNRTLKITLIAEESIFRIDSGAYATGGAKKLKIDGKQGNVTVDTYNSSAGPYDPATAGSGRILAGGSVDINHGSVNATLVSGGGEVKLKKDAHIAGNLEYAGSVTSEGGGSVDEKVEGAIVQNGSVPVPDPIDSLIESKLSTLEGSNDNGLDSDIADEKLVSSQTSWELRNGSYYLDKIELKDGETLTLNLSEGDIEIAVDDDVKLDGGNITVTNPDAGTARIYLDDKNIDITGGSNVTIPGHRSQALWIYARPKANIKIEESSFTGVIYAPATTSEEGKLEIKKEAVVYGAIIGSDADLKEGATVHFDEALKDIDPIPTGETIPALTYLHISVNYVNVSVA